MNGIFDFTIIKIIKEPHTVPHKIQPYLRELELPKK